MDEQAVPMPAQTGVQHVQVDAERAGQRLDNWLLARLRGVPRSLVYRWLRSGQVRVNGGRAKPHRRLERGDEVRIPPVRLPSRGAPGAPAPAALAGLRRAIMHEDRDFIVIDKPAGMAAHGGSGVSHGVIELLRHLRPEEDLQLAHRLDRDTSGIIVVCRRRAALRAVQEALRSQQVVRQYLALLEGVPARERFDVNVPLRKFVPAGGEHLVRVSPDGKPALSFFRRIERYGSATLYEVTLATGRTHQIRVHAAHVGHPVAGDGKYASHAACARFHAAGLRRLFLHASRFEFTWREETRSFTASLPDELKQVLDTLTRQKG